MTVRLVRLVNLRKRLPVVRWRHAVHHQLNESPAPCRFHKDNAGSVLEVPADAAAKVSCCWGGMVEKVQLNTRNNLPNCGGPVWRCAPPNASGAALT